MKPSVLTVWSILWVLSILILPVLSSCGGADDCTAILSAATPDPTGRWTGVLVREESDCGDASRGERFSFNHDVSSLCDIDDDPELTLSNEDGRFFRETSNSSFLGDGSFTVQHEERDITIDISYDNYDGSLADVTQKIRLYEGGRLRCSERYKGQARR